MAIRTSSSASSRNRKKRISRSSRSPESMSPRWSRDSSRSRKRPSGGRGDGSCGLAAALPAEDCPVTSRRPAAAGAPTAGEGAVARKRAPEPVPVGGCGCMPPARCGCTGYTRYPSHSDRNFFPQMDEPCQMCRPLHLTLLFWFQKRPQGVQQLHGGAIAAAVFLCQRQKLPQQRRVQPAQSAKACRPSARLILRIGGRRR